MRVLLVCVLSCILLAKNTLQQQQQQQPQQQQQDGQTKSATSAAKGNKGGGGGGGGGGGRRKLDTVVVNTPLGRIVGLRDGATNAYLGIPFAEPPTGTHRFRPPRPKRAWSPSSYRAFNFSPECLQSTLFADSEDGIPKDEDCLYLNIWQPAKPKGHGLSPVLLWIYGGAWIHGGASKPEYIGNQLAARGVVVVSCNYRLGALGFLVSTADGLYGNYGLADQKLAMQWVQDNIRAFGGDPRRVTLFGESAGAMSIGLHLLDQQQRHSKMHQLKKPKPWLFHAIILQSNPIGYKYRTVAVANFLGAAFKDRLDCEDLRCLQSESPDELIHVQDTLMAVPRSVGDFFSWGPVVTDQFFWREYRLRPGPISNITVRQPIEAMKMLIDANKRLDVPVIMGTTSHEGTVFVFTAYPTRMPKIIYQAAIFSFFRTSAPRVLKQYAKLSQRISESPYPDYRLALSTVIGDYLFRCPNQLFASQLTAANTSVFLYEFTLATRTPGKIACMQIHKIYTDLHALTRWSDVITTTYTAYNANILLYIQDFLVVMAWRATRPSCPTFSTK